MILKMVLIAALLISIITDLQKRKILNIVTIPSILIALIFYATTLGWEGFVFTTRGFAVGLGLLIIPYLLGGIGAGDVKLMAAIGALMGTSFVFYSFIYTALIGGLIAVVVIIKQKGFINSMKSYYYSVGFFRK
ncbi:A24 family peptidase [Neobacillus sp. 19]|uniref:A24 family peptidase n=1 Tax=Neobacillus sp. 19 TaxID=3394458 RepID=UPI003BF73CB4